jgi:hypothetical protein
MAFGLYREMGGEQISVMGNCAETIKTSTGWRPTQPQLFADRCKRIIRWYYSGKRKETNLLELSPMNSLKIMVQHRETKAFHNGETWTAVEEEAFEFPDVLNAFNFASRHGLDDAEIVFRRRPVSPRSNPSTVPSDRTAATGA